MYLTLFQSDLQSSWDKTWDTVLNLIILLISLQIVKSVEFVNRETMNDLRPCMDYLRKSIALREQLEGDHHKVRTSL